MSSSPSMFLPVAEFLSFLWLNSIPLCVWTISLFSHLWMDTLVVPMSWLLWIIWSSSLYCTSCGGLDMQPSGPYHGCCVSACTEHYGPSSRERSVRVCMWTAGTPEPRLWAGWGWYLLGSLKCGPHSVSEKVRPSPSHGCLPRPMCTMGCDSLGCGRRGVEWGFQCG